MRHMRRPMLYTDRPIWMNQAVRRIIAAGEEIRDEDPDTVVYSVRAVALTQALKELEQMRNGILHAQAEADRRRREPPPVDSKPPWE